MSGHHQAHIVYPIATSVVVLFGIFGLLAGRILYRSKSFNSQEEFLTARNSAGRIRIAWSFYAGAMGSWALFGAPSYAYVAGWVGMMMYSLSAGIPIIILAYFGTVLQRKLPDVYSFSDYIQKRFGKIVQLYVNSIMLLAMGVALTAEYITVGSLFSDIIHVTQIPIVIIIGLVSSIYAAYGGLHASLVTDQAQAGFSLVLVVILFSWVAATFRPHLGPLPSGPDPNDPNDLTPNLTGSNYTGLASIATMPISLMAATIFAEGPWQRCWASVNNRTLMLGSVLGACTIVVVTFLFSFGGFLAAWSGYFVPTGPDDYGNTILFTLLSNKKGGVVPTTWILVLVTCLSVTISTSAVDNFQNAIASNISGVYFKKGSAWWSRALVILINVPCIIVSLKGYNVVSLFLFANIMCTTASIPILFGLFEGRFAQKFVTPASTLFGCILGFLSVVVYAIIQAPNWQLSNKDALHKVFLDVYDWPQFLLALGFSFVGMVLVAGIENLLNYQILGQCDIYNSSETMISTSDCVKLSSFSAVMDRSTSSDDELGVSALTEDHSSHVNLDKDLKFRDT